MTIDSILAEWSYRLPSGYPTKSKDYELLYHVILEMTDVTPLVAQNIVNKAQGLNEAEGDVLANNNTKSSPADIKDQISEIGLSADINNLIFITYNGLSDLEKQEFNKNLRAHTIESYVAGGYIPFIKFYGITPPAAARGGMGRGEIQTLLAVKNSVPGGTERHDIVLPGQKEWEIKETKGGKFDPAGPGLAVKFPLTKLIQDFYNNIVYPMSQLGDPYEVLKDYVDPAALEPLQKLMHIIEHNFESAIDIDKLQSFEWKKTAWVNWYAGFNALHQIFYKTKLDTSVRDTRLSINKDGDISTYWISDDHADKINLASGEHAPTSILIGTKIDDTNKDVIVWFKRIERNIFIKNPAAFIQYLNEIKNAFFNEANLIRFEIERPAIPHISLASDFVIDTMSQGRYRFVYKQATSARGVDYLQDQS